ncbi:MAG: enoyl-CoA hydratase/isomerase family protein [SAR202 cluster bacterium]|nr:enoyl-CoA hydratase/isomerase family protein [Dehalococcoidia bacterium]MQG40527.1 enoyl-CoA hydratase/isomerase family protein [SAR202 cluster bacterium]MQG72649.1 enoyl-CoA hydratase/isomerase family protein [SAR202 cluster bacterium]|tara:strand:- start:1158 stop:1919 length:762 start_codon:yes stop_codon:yes gene_type:complete
MTSLDEYADKYPSIRMERRNGILQMTFHTDDGPLQWGGSPHKEFSQVFVDVGSDFENRIVIMTGTGDTFTGPQGTAATTPKRPPKDWDQTYWEGKRILTSLLDIEVPMISAINGPALRHSEIPLLCDIVLASDTAAFQDSGHFMSGLVPGDGMHIVYPLLLGVNRGRYFLLTGQRIEAQEAQELGLVNEVMPQSELLPRAWELAEQMAKNSDIVLRYTRVAMNLVIKRQIHDLLGYGLALEGLGSADTMLNQG